MRISDWSFRRVRFRSHYLEHRPDGVAAVAARAGRMMPHVSNKPNVVRDGYEAVAEKLSERCRTGRGLRYCVFLDWEGDRKCDVKGTSVSGRVDLGGRRRIQKITTHMPLQTQFTT